MGSGADGVRGRWGHLQSSEYLLLAVNNAGLFFVRSSTGGHLAKMPKNRVFGFSNRVSGLLEQIFGVF